MATNKQVREIVGDYTAIPPGQWWILQYRYTGQNRSKHDGKWKVYFFGRCFHDQQPSAIKAYNRQFKKTVPGYVLRLVQLTANVIFDTTGHRDQPELLIETIPRESLPYNELHPRYEGHRRGHLYVGQIFDIRPSLSPKIRATAWKDGMMSGRNRNKIIAITKSKYNEDMDFVRSLHGGLAANWRWTQISYRVLEIACTVIRPEPVRTKTSRTKPPKPIQMNFDEF